MELMEADSSKLALLPSLVFLKIMKLLSKNFNDIRSLSYTCKQLRAMVTQNLHRFYHLNMHLDNSVVFRDVDFGDDIDYKKKVLSLTLTSSVDREPLVDPEEEARNFQLWLSLLPYKNYFQIINKLDLSNVKSLEIRNLNSNYRKGFDKIKQFVPGNKTLYCTKSLEFLKMDVHLINLSEIRNSIINVLYQHDDFATGGPITNIDYIVNSAVSQVLFNFLQFVDDLFSSANPNAYDPYGRCYLKELEVNFIPEPDSDWKGPELDRENLNRTEVSQLRECLEFMINEFKRRIKLKQGVTRKIVAKGIPNMFYNDVVELTKEALDESTLFWNVEQKQKFSITDEKLEDNFSLIIEFSP